ncbi:MAG: GNAT family protein [Actinomycetota bacterium]
MTATGPVLHGERVTLRPAAAADAEAFAEMLAYPEVARWWGRFDIERVRRELIAPDDESVVFAVECDGRVAGLIMYYEEADPDYRHAGIDLSLHPEFQGRGLGPDALRALARHLFADRGHHRLTIDPAVENERAVRAYRRVGFRPVGVMRRYERAPDGSWRDGLLMDLLRDEVE